MLPLTSASFNVKRIVSILIVAGFLSATPAYAADSTSHILDTATGFVDTAASTTRAWLMGQKIQLGKDIAALQAQEASTTQTATGQRINDAVGSNLVPAVRPTGTIGETATRLAKQILLFFVILAMYIVEHKILLYITIGILAFLILRLLWRMVGRQQL